MLMRLNDSFADPFALFDRFLDDVSAFPERPPRIAVSEAEDAIVLTAELPGVKKDGLRLSIHEGVLTLQGERQTEVPEGFRVVRRERSTMKFQKRVTLPERLDLDRTEAHLNDGVLTVHLPKRAAPTPIEIKIQSENKEQS